MRRAVIGISALVLVGVVVLGLTQAGGKGTSAATARRFDLQAARARLQGAPPPLAALYDQPSALLPGGRDAFAKRLRGLRGHPVVINKWASWCGPCRAEFPLFQSLSTEQGRRVAFLGVDARDKRPAAARFLGQFPLPYPSYEDPGEAIARSLKAPQNFPITIFVDAKGRTTFIHQGGYTSEAALAADVSRHLG
jgi:cytochrome c biogenesis protein CcmG, thiol:disulfide interchange protein DsbE